MERRKCRDIPHVSRGDDGVCKEYRIVVNVRATKIEQPWEQGERERRREEERRGEKSWEVREAGERRLGMEMRSLTRERK